MVKTEKSVFTIVWLQKTRPFRESGEVVKTKHNVGTGNQSGHLNPPGHAPGTPLGKNLDGHGAPSSSLHHFANTPGKQGSNDGEDQKTSLHRVFTTSPSGGFDLPFGAAQYPFRRWLPAYSRVIAGRFALDTETTLIDDTRPASIPALVLGMAFDGQHGWFVMAEDMPAFLAAHPTNPIVFHNAAFDLAVLQATYDRLGIRADVYARVEAGRVADTQILARLISLATVGHSARSQCSLDYCSQKYLGIALPKDLTTPGGESVRLTFGRYLGRPFESLPTEHLTYAATDPVATFLLFAQLKAALPTIKATAYEAFGYAGDSWLGQQQRTHGPLTHDIQLKASIVLDRLSRTGVLIDQTRRDEKVVALQNIVTEARRTLALAGLPVEGKGAQSALRKRIERLAAKNKDLPLAHTETGQIATSEEQLRELSSLDPVLDVLLKHRQATKLLSTYASKMHPGKKVHGRFNYLMNTGRTSCGGGFNLQNLPKELDAGSHETTIRGCFVPAPGKVFVVVDYAQIELVVLAWAWKYQLGFGDSLHTIVTEGRDMHRLIAAKVLGKDPSDVTKQERNAAKPVSLGRPGGLGWKTIQKQAKVTYGVDLTEEEVRSRMQAYEDLCPELTKHLESRVDAGLEIARALGMTPLAYNAALGRRSPYPKVTDEEPAGWLGGMLLKVLESPAPMTRGNRDTNSPPRLYTPQETNFFWTAAERLTAFGLDEKYINDIRARKPSRALREAVAGIFSREPIITATGRIRANASYSACRNGIMQGLAADGAIHALWKLMRAGYPISNFIHDEVIIEVPEDENLPAKIADIERLMKEGMQVVVPGANVRVETSVRRSFSKADEVPPSVP
jgi:DNA polymerase I-like protein with 3'-5' exonuclease and polymerase domains